MSLREFWKNNKLGYIWSCVALLLGGIFICLVKQIDVQESLPFIILTFPLCFIMAYGFYSIGGNN